MKKQPARKPAKKVTLRHVERVIVDLYQGKTQHGYATSYDQAEFCGTSCCVLGHANALAGNGPRSCSYFRDLLRNMSKRTSNVKKKKFGSQVCSYWKALTQEMDKRLTSIDQFVLIMCHYGRWKPEYKVQGDKRRVSSLGLRDSDL